MNRRVMTGVIRREKGHPRWVIWLAILESGLLVQRVSRWTVS